MRRRDVERSQQSRERTGEWRHTERAASQLSRRALPARPGAGRCSTSSPTRCRSSSSHCWPGSAGAGRGSGMWSTPLWRCAVTSPAHLSRCSRRAPRVSRSPARPPSCGSASRSTRCRSTRRRNSSRSCTWCSATCVTSRSTRTASSRWHGRSTAELRGRRPPGVAQSDVQDAARLIEWLVDGRFSFLGYHRYDGAGPPRPGSPRLADSGLGVLRHEEVARWVFDGVDPGLSRGRRHGCDHPGQRAEPGVPARAPVGSGRSDPRPGGTGGTRAPVSRRTHDGRAPRECAGDPDDRTAGSGLGESGGCAPGVTYGAADARGDRRVPAGGTALGRRGSAARSRCRGAGAHPTAAAASVRRARTLPTVLLVPGLPAA